MVEAARRAGRSAEEITLMAVTKTVDPASIRQAYESGVRLFGENRVQEFQRKAELLHDVQPAEWHLIGHLQTNKAALAAELFAAIDSVDSLRLMEKLNQAAAHRDKKIPILLEINIGSEESKGGFSPDSAELEKLLQSARDFEYLKIRGLMTIPPFTEACEASRPHFRKLRELRDKIATRHLLGLKMDTLSMGMSHDFEVAIEEGSTCVRIGTAIFGERIKP